MSLLTGIYIFIILILSVYGMHRSVLVYQLIRKRYRQPEVPIDPECHPHVCVQLPLYNEELVAERLIRTVSAFRYSGKLSIQVLDDSTDQTSEIVDRVVSELQQKGISIEAVRRDSRDGYKAGALKYGMEQSDAELFAIFDADFVPDVDFLEHTVPHFQKKEVGFVQARWGHLNRDYSLLTRAEAILIDAHFMVEHASRYNTGAFFNFNGTAGVWRREAVIEGGGWQGDTITEDLDLSYRVQLAGWKGEYLRDVISKSELPETVSAFKSQQYRWSKGTTQVFKKLMPSLLRSSMTPYQKIEAFFHLSGVFCYFLILLVALLLVPISVCRLCNNFSMSSWLEAYIFIFTMVSMTGFFVFSQWEQQRRVRPLDILLAICLGAGMGAHLGVAVIAGLRSKVGEFVRTPKRGSIWKKREQTTRDTLVSYFWRELRKHPKEILVAFYLVIGLVYLFTLSHFLTIPFLLLILSGYLLILVSAVCDPEGKQL